MLADTCKTLGVGRAAGREEMSEMTAVWGRHYDGGQSLESLRGQAASLRELSMHSRSPSEEIVFE